MVGDVPPGMARGIPPGMREPWFGMTQGMRSAWRRGRAPHGAGPRIKNGVIEPNKRNGCLACRPVSVCMVFVFAFAVLLCPLGIFYHSL